MTDQPDDFENPRELLTHLWSRLESAVADRASPLRIATFCTNGLDGFPAARSVIMRYVSPSLSQIRFQTDFRSPKVAELLRDPRSAMLFWDSSTKTQLRLAGNAIVSRDDAASRELIANSHPGSLAVFRNLSVPSTPIASPNEAVLAESPLLQNVALVSFNVQTLEWLWLDDAGHRRCRFTFGDANVSHQWLVP